MKKDIVTSLVAVVALTVICGLAYPLATTGVAQVLFASKADGSQIERDGKVVGSSLIGQDFQRPVLDAGGKPKTDADGNPVLAPDLRYFQSRPSATGYSASATFFNNLGPNNAELRDMLDASMAAYLERERPFTPDLRRDQVPADAVTTSASGVDPHISTANARTQANRVAKERGLPVERVLALVDEHTDGRGFGVFGEPGVTVLQLNLALDRETA